jgi:hypothetical protein
VITARPLVKGSFDRPFRRAGGVEQTQSRRRTWFVVGERAVGTDLAPHLRHQGIQPRRLAIRQSGTFDSRERHWLGLRSIPMIERCGETWDDVRCELRHGHRSEHSAHIEGSHVWWTSRTNNRSEEALDALDDASQRVV